MSKTASFNVLAGILIFLGIILLLENFSILDGAWMIWPFLPLILGTGFVMLFFRNRKKDLVLLGLGTFTGLISLLFFYLNFTSWMLLTYLWPSFIIILGLTFFACWLPSRKRVLLYLGIFLIALGVSFILIFAISANLWPLSLILGGISFITINIFEKRKGAIRGKKK